MSKKDQIIEIILRMPGLGTAEHCILSGIDMEDVEETADEILKLIIDGKTMEGKNESKHTHGDKPLESMVWPISHDRGDFLAVGISLNDVKALYYDSNGTSSLIDASEETIINKTKHIKELQAEVDRLTKEKSECIELVKELVIMVDNRMDDPSRHDQYTFLQLLLNKLRSLKH